MTTTERRTFMLKPKINNQTQAGRHVQLYAHACSHARMVNTLHRSCQNRQLGTSGGADGRTDSGDERRQGKKGTERNRTITGTR